MVTLKDIAKEANVSVMTVSNVVNGNLSKVSKEKAAQIQEILRRRNYVQNASARSLAKANSNIVAIMLRNIDGENALSTPHNATLVGQMVRLLQNCGFYAMVEDRDGIARTLRAWKVRGAVFLGMFDDEIEQIYAASKAPIVFVDSYSNVRRICSIGIDDYKGGRLAAQCFMRHGHTELAFIGPPGHGVGVVQQRLAGFTETLEAGGLSLKPEHRITLESDNSPHALDTAVNALRSLLGRVTGVFATSDQLAMGLMGALAEHGVRIPADLSIIGFDGIPLGSAAIPLTTIKQDIPAIAKTLFELCLHPPKEPRVTILPTEFIPGQTCGWCSR